MNQFCHLSIIFHILRNEKGLSLNRPLSVAKRPLYWMNLLTSDSDIQRRRKVWKYVRRLRRGSGSKRNRRYSTETSSHSAKICGTIAPLSPGSTDPVTYSVDRQDVIDGPHCKYDPKALIVSCFSLFPAYHILILLSPFNTFFDVF